MVFFQRTGNVALIDSNRKLGPVSKSCQKRVRNVSETCLNRVLNHQSSWNELKIMNQNRMHRILADWVPKCNAVSDQC